MNQQNSPFPLFFTLERVENGYILTAKENTGSLSQEPKFRKEVVAEDKISSRVGQLLNLEAMTKERPLLFHIEAVNEGTYKTESWKPSLPLYTSSQRIYLLTPCWFCSSRTPMLLRSVVTRQRRLQRKMTSVSPVQVVFPYFVCLTIKTARSCLPPFANVLSCLPPPRRKSFSGTMSIRSLWNQSRCCWLTLMPRPTSLLRLRLPVTEPPFMKP